MGYYNQLSIVYAVTVALKTLQLLLGIMDVLRQDVLHLASCSAL